jgi:hypothetical protein
MTIQQYLDKINTLYKTGNAREHSYRGDLQNLIMAILPDVLVTNEPARVDCGAPAPARILSRGETNQKTQPYEIKNKHDKTPFFAPV